eukprot:10865589-Heterocapsa_arctica.AAC.1
MVATAGRTGQAVASGPVGWQPCWNSPRSLRHEASRRSRVEDGCASGSPKVTHSTLEYGCASGSPSMDKLKGKGSIFDEAAGREGAKAKDEESLLIETYNVSGWGSLLAYLRRGTPAH